ncbi:hypothetical protein DFH06DRAFT_1412866 [Mycena polygramma]|nr:hypothetical protein DFH06DRAFT_1412866 [Mycena polygramma]
MSTEPPLRNSRGRDYLAKLEEGYGLPAKQFLKDLYDEYPLATTALVIFAATSFTPVVVSAALAVFTVCLAVSASLVTLIGLVLCLTVILSTTLLSSVLVTLLANGALRLRHSGDWLNTVRTPAAEAHQEVSDANPNPPKRRAPRMTPAVLVATKKIFRTLLAPLGRSWKARILTTIILFDAISRIRLPRVVRYNLIYRTIFGASLFGPRRAHWLQRALSRPFALLRTVFWVVPVLGINIARLPLRIFGWKLPLAMCILLLVRFRSKGFARRGLKRAAVVLSTAVGSGVTLVMRSEAAAKLRDVPWKAYTATAMAYAQVVRTVLTALVAFLRAQLEELEETPATPAGAGSHAEDATYEMVNVSPVDTTPEPVDSILVPGASVEVTTLRARRITVDTAEEE